MDTDGRLAELERTTETMQARLRRLERTLHIDTPVAAPAPAVAFVAPAPPPACAPAPVPAPEPAPVPAPAPARPPRAPRPQLSLEDLLAGRVLAWGGGAAVLIGIVLLFGIAVSRGWIGPGARTIIAAAVALTLGVLGVWLHERKGRTDAALAAISTSIAALFVCDVVASRVYHLIAPTAGIVLALLIGATATVLALRWRATGIAALGLGGALLAPVLAGVGATDGSMPFLFVAAACATAVCIHERWTWLGAGVLAITAPQWILWLTSQDPAPAVAVAAMTAFGALGLLAAIGYELRDREAGLHGPSIYLAAANALLLGFVGGYALNRLGGSSWVDGWPVGLAVAHLGLGIALRGGSRAVRGLLLGLGVALADVAAGLILGGPALTISWVAGAIVMCLVTRRLHGTEQTAAQAGLSAQLAIALIQALSGGAAFGAAQNATALDVASLVSVIAVAAGCFTCARLRSEDDDSALLRPALDLTAMALLALITAMTLHGPQLVVAWTIEAYALGRVARREAERDPLAAWGSLSFLGGGIALALSLAAPSIGIDATAIPSLPILGALGAGVLGCFACARLYEAHDPLRLALDGVALGLVALTTALVLDGPALVAAWAVEATIVVAGRRFLDERAVRGGAPVLLGLGLAHVLAFDAPPDALVVGAPAALGAAAALGALVAGTAACALLLRGAGEDRAIDRFGFGVAAAVLALYLGSVELITAFQPSVTVVGDDLGIGVRQLGQMLLSGGWALVGLIALVAGLRRQSLAVRRAGLALLMLAMAKVAIFDLATLDSFYRVLSFVALGLLLLAGAFAWQRARPKPLPDLRAAPPAIR